MRGEVVSAVYERVESVFLRALDTGIVHEALHLRLRQGALERVRSNTDYGASSSPDHALIEAAAGVVIKGDVQPGGVRCIVGCNLFDRLCRTTRQGGGSDLSDKRVCARNHPTNSPANEYVSYRGGQTCCWDSNLGGSVYERGFSRLLCSVNLQHVLKFLRLLQSPVVKGCVNLARNFVHRGLKPCAAGGYTHRNKAQGAHSRQGQV